MTLTDDVWVARIAAALSAPGYFAHREVGEDSMGFRARAVACALRYDDEELRGMGLAGGGRHPPSAATQEFPPILGEQRLVGPLRVPPDEPLLAEPMQEPTYYNRWPEGLPVAAAIATLILLAVIALLLLR